MSAQRKGVELEHPERDLVIDDRESGPQRSDLERLRERIQKARAMAPTNPHCADCWTKGRDAAIRAIEEGDGT